MASSITKEQVVSVLDRMFDGMTFKAACEAEGLKRKTVFDAIDTYELAATYARAKEGYAMARVDEMDYIAQTEDDVGRARLRCDNIKWEMSRVASRIYGDKTQTEITGKDGAALVIQVVKFGDDNPTG